MRLPELKIELSKMQIPQTLEINEYTRIVDVPKFLSSHIGVLEANAKKISFIPYWDRLWEVYLLIKECQT